MRLIDADNLKQRIRATMDMQDLYLPVHFMQLINEQDEIQPEDYSTVWQDGFSCGVEQTEQAFKARETE